MRWSWKRQEFFSSIKYIKRETNVVADYLSRYPERKEEFLEREGGFMYPPILGKLAFVSTIDLKK